MSGHMRLELKVPEGLWEIIEGFATKHDTTRVICYGEPYFADPSGATVDLDLALMDPISCAKEDAMPMCVTEEWWKLIKENSLVLAPYNLGSLEMDADGYWLKHADHCLIFDLKFRQVSVARRSEL